MTDPAGTGQSGDVAVSASGAAAPALAMEVPEFRDIYEQYFDFVWRSARRLGVAPRGLDDAVQDVFLVVHRRLGDYSGRSSLKSWIFGITRRVARDHRRRVERKEGRLVADGDAELAFADDHHESPRECAARGEAMEMLYRFLGQLEDAKREVFIMAELEQMTAPEIAEALDINLNTAYSRLRAARREFERAVERFQARDRGGEL